MRVEAAPFVYRNDERPQRFEDPRTTQDERCAEQAQSGPRARHAAHVWFSPPFGAHILGQATPHRVTPAEAARAYTQPESRTPLRPKHSRSI